MNTRNIFRSLGLAALVSLAFSSCIKDYENPAKGTPGELTTIYALRQAHVPGRDITLDAGVLGGASKIEGVVISDPNGKNLDENSFVLQQTVATGNAVTDVTRGIVVKLSGAATYLPGDSLLVDVSGAVLGRVNGKLTLSGLSAGHITVVASNRTPLSRPVTRGILHTRMDEYESTLVTMHADVSGHSAGATLSGLKTLDDHTGDAVYLYTMSHAPHAAAALPVNAEFGGIAAYLESGNALPSNRIAILPRNGADINFASGPLYANFPESFENPDASTKGSYNSGTNIVTLGTGNWYLFQTILANTAGSDRYNVPGKQGLRIQQNLTASAYVQMNFDVPDGASKVTVFYGRYGSDARSSFRLEYSTNGGTSWTPVGATIVNAADKLMKQATWTVNISGPVRFRINKLGTGTSNNGRLSLDDFAIYKKL